MAGLVAAGSVAALEIQETGLVQTQGAQANQTMLAQIKDDEADVKAPDNGNTNRLPKEPEPALPETTEIDEKIELLTTANLAGLTAKEDFILKKLKYFKKEQIEIFCDMDEACRAKLATQLEKSKAEIDQAAVEAAAAAKKCRVDFVNELLTEKETIKGRLEDLLNETIQKIKELKVEGILQESGMPAEEHKEVLDAQIETLIMEFEMASDEMLTDETTGFITICTAAFEAFEDTEVADAEETCLDKVQVEFAKAFENAEPADDEELG